jgi:hypothetical protein
VGGSIEDYSGDASSPIYAFDLAVERVRVAAEAARSLDFPFILTARAENLLWGKHDLNDTIRSVACRRSSQPGLMRCMHQGIPRSHARPAVVSTSNIPRRILMNGKTGNQRIGRIMSVLLRSIIDGDDGLMFDIDAAEAAVAFKR